ncbi:hypothetical protein [uncultured Draconibacterium sp.]|uniref:hypothetical protein n=1 Tax=uncultured Draconibacterium sp. TaxID=1573823 RepID=UPI00321738F7
MNWKKLKHIVPILFLVVAVYLVFFKPASLTRSLNVGIEVPIGTLVSWMGLFAYALLFYNLLPSGKRTFFVKGVQKVLLVNLIAASFWGIISAALAGNWALNFGNGNVFFVWIIFTVFILVLPLLSYLLLGLKKVFSRF